MFDFLASISWIGWGVIAILALFLWNLPKMILGLRHGDMQDDVTGQRPTGRPRSDGRIDDDL